MIIFKKDAYVLVDRVAQVRHTVELRESSDQSDLLPDHLKRHMHLATMAIPKFSLAEPC